MRDLGQSAESFRHRCCGIGDEAAKDFPSQIATIVRLGWSSMELRSIDGTPFADLDDAQFEAIATALSEAGIDVPVVCSRIGSWARDRDAAFEDDLKELRRIGARARALGTRFVRVMSYPALETALQGKRIAIERMRRLVDAAGETGLVLLHENCVGWAGGAHPERVLELIYEVASSALRVLFDVGNGLAYGYDARTLLEQVLPLVAHVHVKDGIRTGNDVRWVPPGEGEAHVEDCVARLLVHGYDGLFSMEPHMFTIPHQGIQAAEGEAVESFVAYGRRFEELVSARGATGGAALP